MAGTPPGLFLLLLSSPDTNVGCFVCGASAELDSVVRTPGLCCAACTDTFLVRSAANQHAVTDFHSVPRPFDAAAVWCRNISVNLQLAVVHPFYPSGLGGLSFCSVSFCSVTPFRAASIFRRLSVSAVVTILGGCFSLIVSVIIPFLSCLVPNCHDQVYTVL